MYGLQTLCQSEKERFGNIDLRHFEVGTKKQIITEGEGSTQVGELTAVWRVFQHEAQATSPVYVYTDSYRVFKGCTEWLPFWEQNE